MPDFRRGRQRVHQGKGCNTSSRISGAGFCDVLEERVCHFIQLSFQWLIAFDAKDLAEPSAATAVRASEESQGGFDVVGCEALIYMAALELPFAVQF